MKRRDFLNKGALGIVGISSFPYNKSFFNNFKKIKITLTPWSLIRSGFGSTDPLNVNHLEYPFVAKSLGFDYIDHEMFHFPSKLTADYINRMNLSLIHISEPTRPY